MVELTAYTQNLRSSITSNGHICVALDGSCIISSLFKRTACCTCNYFKFM